MRSTVPVKKVSPTSVSVPLWSLHEAGVLSGPGRVAHCVQKPDV